MKMKGITFAEQHVEKGVLGLAVLALVGVGVWQFLSRPNQVDVDGRRVNPGEIDGILRDRAESLNLQLRDDAPLQADPFAGDPPLRSDSFMAQLDAGLSMDRRLPRTQPSLAQALVPIDLGADAWYGEPRIPAARIVADVQQTDDALADEAIEQHRELAARFGSAGASRDISFLTPTATIDPVAIRAALRASDSAATPPRVAIPSLWYNDRISILDVQCEREERLDDGSFGNRIVVTTLPGQTTLRPEIESNPDATARNEMLERLADDRVQRAILQPDFLPTRNNAFTPPAIEAAAGPTIGREPGIELRDALDRLRREAARVRDRLDEAGGPLEDERAPGRPPREGGGRGSGGGATAPPGLGPGGGLGGGAMGPPDGGTGTGDGVRGAGSDRERRNLTRRLRALEERERSAEDQLREIAPHLLDGVAVVESPFNLAGDDPIQIWAHDIDVRPGGVYRYRFVVRTYNPFFARKRQLVEEQSALADHIAIDSTPSDWTDPVELTPPVAFFVSRAIPGDGPLGLGTAQIEVFRLHEGKWRRDVFSVSPGDRIGRVVDPPRGRDGETPVDYTTDWFVVDIIDDPTGEPRPDRSRPALVVLQHLGTGTRFEIRDPALDQSDRRRQRLYRDFSVG